ncbi:MAG TPA: head GIN domain-containing protein [Allosphingosinicella sp.]
MPAFALSLLVVAAPAGAAERRYPVTDFTKVQVEGPFQVVLKTGLNSSARAEGSAAGLDRLSVEVVSGTLRVRTNRSAWGGYPGDTVGPVRIEVTTRDLSAASVIGSGGLEIDKVRGLRIDLSLSGSGRLSVAAAEADNLFLGLVGAGRMSLAGKAKQLKATIQGSGDLAAEGLRAEDAQLSADTSGLVTFTAGRTAKVRASGPGDVAILGTPTCEVEARGAGRVSCGR